MSKKVLVVDDDPNVRLINVTVVEQSGHIPIEAEDGEQALKLINKAPPDLVMLDILMPRQSGIRLFRELKTNPKWKEIPVIVLSGIAKRTFLRSQKALTEFGGEAVPEPEFYFEKPVESEELEKTLKEILG